MARELPYIQAIGEAVHQEMARDDTVLYFGQNLALTDEDPFVKAFGADRVRVTPISETAEIGIWRCRLAGYRPVVQLYMAEFMLVAMDQVERGASVLRHVRRPGEGADRPPGRYGFTAGWAGQHTGTIYSMFMGVPGLKVVVPSTPADAKGLMTAAIRDDNPVILFHNYLLTLEHGDVPEGEHVVPIGRVAVVREPMSRSSESAGPSGKRWPRRSSWPERASMPRWSILAHSRRSTRRRSSSRSRRPAGSSWSTRRRGMARRRRSSLPRSHPRASRPEGARRARDGSRRDDPVLRADGAVPAARRDEDRRRGAEGARRPVAA